MGEVAIRVAGLSKKYRIGKPTEQYGRLTESLWSGLTAPFRANRGSGATTDFWALRDVSFDIARGSAVGVIGRNGAGKSTLLKILARITEPTSGRAELSGRVGSLLEVGTGFHSELTGRENISLSGAVLGMRRAEIARRFDEIIDFADIGPFLETPIKRYSSGMKVRLGFAVAAFLEPEILFVDEVLAVGDLAFQAKCLAKVGDVARDGRTVVFVSHNMGAITTLCPTSLWLDGGTVRMAGATSEVVPEYVQAFGDTGTGALAIEPDERHEAQVLRVRTLSESGEVLTIAECSDPVTIEMLLAVRRRLPGLRAYLEFRLPTGTTVLMSESLDTTPNPLDNLDLGTYLVTATIPPRTLGPGTYDIYVNFTSFAGDRFDVHSPGVVGSFRLHDSNTQRGNARPGFFSTLLEWTALRVNASVDEINEASGHIPSGPNSG
jgi:lipopolysaccharide transport system ATP-binding protein